MSLKIFRSKHFFFVSKIATTQFFENFCQTLCFIETFFDKFLSKNFSSFFNKQISKQASKKTNENKSSKQTSDHWKTFVQKTFFLFQKLLLHNFLKNFHQTLCFIETFFEKFLSQNFSSFLNNQCASKQEKKQKATNK